MITVAERTFTSADQESFAALSGDSNPVHMDPVAARRTIFGAPVVHGVHLACWALDRWLGTASIGHDGAALENVSACFDKGVLVGDTVRVGAMHDGQQFTLVIQRQQSDMASIQGKLGPRFAYGETFPKIEAGDCREMSLAEARHAAGSFPLAFSEAEAIALFPNLAAALPPIQIAALLASTRLVGMECPGRHSLYSALDLSFSKQPAGEPRLNYRVARADMFGALNLAIDGPGFRGELKAFLRPAPRRQATIEDLARLVARDTFSSQRAVVIGGSRGLGEVTAKLLAAGGADVTITYQRGRDDAEAVAAEIHSAGATCRLAQFDSNHPAPISTPEPFNSLYYFATPHISGDKSVAFSADRFAEYCRYYVSGFALTVLAIPFAERASVFYPSTVFLDQSPAHMAEYCAAKAAGEEVCKQLGKQFRGWRFFAPRLPRMHTDQNNGLLPGKMEAPEVVMLRQLMEMKESVV